MWSFSYTQTHTPASVSAVPSSRCTWGWLNGVSLVNATSFCLQIPVVLFIAVEVELDLSFERLFIQGVSLLCISRNLKQLRSSLEPERCPGPVIITSMHLFGCEVRGHVSAPQAWVVVMFLGWAIGVGCRPVDDVDCKLSPFHHMNRL